ncbi:4518_t:CDS:1 [Cetraspora pellucida]|uniref:4518_t:CDS:1 n=1 Tax=Cetraspora pellucida TaxID=1433469 RepID=A0A9N9F547_9GLOM|nr:4518_t:CDS:1 [Cetraspora pellucida]
MQTSFPEVNKSKREKRQNTNPLDLLEAVKAIEVVEIFRAIAEYYQSKEINEKFNLRDWTPGFKNSKVEYGKLTEANLNQYLEQKRQQELIIQQQDTEFYSEITWAYQNWYHNMRGTKDSENNSIVINENYLIDSSK